jgi:antitoxin Phd
MTRWELQDAQQQLSRVIDRAQSQGPQVVAVNGEEVAVVLDIEEYRLLSHRGDFKKFLESAPDVDLPIDRSREPHVFPTFD